MADRQTTGSNELSPELIKKVSDKVYALFLADLKRERERSRRKHQSKRKK